MGPDEIVQQVFRVLETGDAVLAAETYAPDYENLAAVVSPPACATRGPGAALATGAWLRSAYDGLAYTVFDAVEHGDQVWARVRMSGRHTGPFVRFRDGVVDQVLPPTGRSIDVEHFHVLTLRDGRVVAHQAVRDDLGMIRQLGVLPPTPAVVARILAYRISGRAARATEDAVRLAEAAADAVPVA